MRSSLSSLALALVAADYSEALGFPRAQAGKGFLAIPVGTVKNRPHQKRQEDDSIETVLLNKDTFYATEIELGNPGQSVTVLVDTGSSELWVNPDCYTALSATQEEQCQSFGQYNPDDSDTPPVGPFGSEEINYGDPTDESTQTWVEIVYYADDLGWPDSDAQIKNQTFGVVQDSKGQSQGILGLAPDLYAGYDGQAPYSLLLNTIADQGLIASRVFSLDLRHSSEDTGALIYGGVDKSRFYGELATLPLASGIHDEPRLGVNLKSFGITTNGNSQSVDLETDDQNVMLDSGTSLCRLHSAIVEPIMDTLDAELYSQGYYVVDCDKRYENNTINFGFGDKIIKVSYYDFILEFEGLGGSSQCIAGAVETIDQQILGDTVLRAGYFVFDWDNQEVHVAQAATCGDPDIVAIGSGSDAVPDVTGNCEESDSAPPSSSADDSASKTSSTEASSKTSVSASSSNASKTSAGATVTKASDNTDGKDGDGDSAGVRSHAATGLVALFGFAAALYNVL